MDPNQDGAKRIHGRYDNDVALHFEAAKNGPSYVEIKSSGWPGLRALSARIAVNRPSPVKANGQQAKSGKKYVVPVCRIGFTV